jgi:hypothetical protein
LSGRGLVRRTLRALAVLVLLAIGIGILSFSIASSGNSAQKDFISYWAAGQLLIRHSNPYDAAAVFQLEKSAGFTEPEPLVMRNPPYALVLALPLGLFSPNAGVVVWSVLIVACLMAAVRLLWILHGSPPNRTHLLIYVFAPALACVQLGQTSSFALLGLVLFLYLHRKHPFAAGMALPLLLIKPHLLLPFCAVLLLWIFHRRAWPVAAGAAATALVSTAIAMGFEPAILQDYRPVLTAANSASGMIPTISSLLRQTLFRGAPWAQMLPALAAILWAVWYFRKHRANWSWEASGALVVLVSIWLAPYSWFTDEILLAPAMLRAIYIAGDRPWPMRAFAFLDAAALGLVVWGVSLGSGAFLWTTSAWLIWYACTTRETQPRPEVRLAAGVRK